MRYLGIWVSVYAAGNHNPQLALMCRHLSVMTLFTARDEQTLSIWSMHESVTNIQVHIHSLYTQPEPQIIEQCAACLSCASASIEV